MKGGYSKATSVRGNRLGSFRLLKLEKSMGFEIEI